MTRALVTSVFIAVALFGCSNQAQNEASQLVKSARTDYQRGEYEKVIDKITRALNLTNGGEWTFSASNNFSGEWTYLRGKSYFALGANNKALGDFTTSVATGKEYINSHTYASNPFPGKNQEWERTFGEYFSSLAQTQTILGQCNAALDNYTAAINVGYRNLFPKGISKQIDSAIATVFADENAQRKNYARSIGAFSYNRGILNRALGNESEAKKDLIVAEKLKYDKTGIIRSQLQCDG